MPDLPSDPHRRTKKTIAQTGFTPEEQAELDRMWRWLESLAEYRWYHRLGRWWRHRHA